MFRSLITATVLLSAMTLASFGAQQQPQQQQPQQPPQQQQDQQQQKQKDSASKNPDRRFMTEAAQGGMAEVELGRIAAERASNEEVKRFGQRMVDDHTKANQELMQLAQSKGVALPTEMDSSHRSMRDRLGKLSGAEFDREYMRGQVKDHEKTVALFEREAQQGKDAEAKAWAEKTLPTLREHLQQARDLATKTGATVAGADTSKKTN